MKRLEYLAHADRPSGDVGSSTRDRGRITMIDAMAAAALPAGERIGRAVGQPVQPASASTSLMRISCADADLGERHFLRTVTRAGNWLNGLNTSPRPASGKGAVRHDYPHSSPPRRASQIKRKKPRPVAVDLSAPFRPT